MGSFNYRSSLKKKGQRNDDITHQKNPQLYKKNNDNQWLKYPSKMSNRKLLIEKRTIKRYSGLFIQYKKLFFTTIKKVFGCVKCLFISITPTDSLRKFLTPAMLFKWSEKMMVTGSVGWELWRWVRQHFIVIIVYPELPRSRERFVGEYYHWTKMLLLNTSWYLVLGNPMTLEVRKIRYSSLYSRIKNLRKVKPSLTYQL